MADASVLAAAWDRYTTNHRDERYTWAACSPRTKASPGVEVLEPFSGQRALDLGCGSGDNAAYLAALGVQVTAIDLSRVQVATARQRWGHLRNLVVEQADAVAYLSTNVEPFDAVYSVFGAVLRPRGLVARRESAAESRWGVRVQSRRCSARHRSVQPG